MSAPKEPFAQIPQFEIIDAGQLAERLRVPKTWIFEQSRKRASDPIPHLRFGKYLRFDLRSEALTDWIRRRIRA